MAAKSLWQAIGDLVGKTKTSASPIHTTIRRCAAGHPMAADWSECPQCKLEKGAARSTQVEQPSGTDTQANPVSAGTVGGSERRPTRVFETNAPSPSPSPARRDTKVFEDNEVGEKRREPPPPTGRPLTGVLYTFTWKRVGQLFQIRAGRNYAGTAETTREGDVTDILLSDDTTMSGTHFLILHSAGKYWISDCNSTNGTFVDGNLITPQGGVELKDDAKILAGNTVFVFKKVLPPTADVVANTTPEGYTPVPEHVLG
jgi:hypothetical protein